MRELTALTEINVPEPKPDDAYSWKLFDRTSAFRASNNSWVPPTTAKRATVMPAWRPRATTCARPRAPPSRN